jgi:isopenicillin N synthase-like dioxygenase
MNALFCALRPLISRYAVAKPKVFPDRVTTRRLSDLGKSMPPGYSAVVGNLQTFVVPDTITGSEDDRTMGRAMVDVWRRDGILQIATNPKGQKIQAKALDASRQFFRRPHSEKAACVDSQSYAGYIASGEEITDGIADYSEIFTVTKDLPLSDHRVQAKWPCHGPCPWLGSEMKEATENYMMWLDAEGEKLLRLIEYGLGITEGYFTNYTRDGWHHARVLRFVDLYLINGSVTYKDIS